MLKERFNDGWNVRELTSLFDAFSGGAKDVKPVTLPHDMMITLPRRADAQSGSRKGYFINGCYEYTKTFYAGEKYRDKVITLEFEGVYMNAAVYVNGDYAGQRPYGYSNFYIPISRFLAFEADNTIKVTVETGNDSRWYSGSGIYRNVNILIGDPIHFDPDGVKITTADMGDGYAVIETSSVIENSGHKADTVFVLTEILAKDGTAVVSDKSPATLWESRTTLRRRLLIRDPGLWDLDSPYLYECRSTILLDGAVIDVKNDHFGLRKLQLDLLHGFRLNGRTVNLRGACIHHDNGVLGAATFEGAEERRVRGLKEAGFNAIRSAHHPASKALLDACDRLGMLVMDEAFDMWSISKTSDDYSRYFPEWWERDVAAMVDKDYNHPSVVLYSIGNEIPDTGSRIGSQWGRKIAEKIKALDKSRFTINSINGMVSVMDKLAARRENQGGNAEINSAMADAGDMMKQAMNTELVSNATEEAYSCVDIAGYNYMDSRYESDKTLYPNRIICGSETFPKDIAANWKLVEENSHVIGDFTWTGWDYLGEAGIGKIDYSGKKTRRFDGEYPWHIAYCGDIDITGDRRPASYYREIVWGLRRDPYIAVEKPDRFGLPARPSPWSWSDTIGSWTWPGWEGKPVKVEVYSGADEVELRLNGNPLGRAAAGKKAAFKAVFTVVYSPGILEALAYSGGKETGRTRIVSASSAAALTLDCDRNTIRADAAELAYISISLTDQAGTLNTSFEKKLSLSVSGPGSLQGFGSANPESEEDYFSPVRTTFNGRALAVIRSNGGAGDIRVTVETEGLPPETITIKAE
jgi:beta-galactosidase